MRTIRGLQITSIVVLSPVLLCMVSLISILFSSIIGWIFPTIQQQPFPAKSAPYQRNSSINHVFKKLQFVFRLRQSSVTLVILFLYLFYILFKVRFNFPLPLFFAGVHGRFIQAADFFFPSM